MSEEPKVYSREIRKARKPHKCCECRGSIQIGERYHIFNGYVDGWYTYKTCTDCEDLRNKVDATIKHSEDRPAFGELYEDVFESRFSTPEWVTQFMDTRRKRGAPESPRGWMEKAEEEMRKQAEQAAEKSC